MYAFFKNLFILVLILVFQLFMYLFFIEPQITKWGASKEEVYMSMIGDKDNLPIISTRAITINAPKHVIWQKLMQLGANRNGFYSYDIIEDNLKEKTKDKNTIIKNLEVGDIIYGSNNKNSTLSVYNFKVLKIQPENNFVLENWGTFLLKSISEQKTRLIIRTQEIKASNLLDSIKNRIIIPFHFIMERRMLLGIKMQSENNTDLFTYRKDIFWFGSIIGSFLLILLIFFLTPHLLIRIIATSILGFSLMSIVFLFEPFYYYGGILFLIIVFIFFNLLKFRKKLKK